MPIAQIDFQMLIQDSQEYGSDNEHMVSRAFFEMKIDDHIYKNLSVNIKQPVGSTFETSNLEISKPAGYNGPFNHQAFRQAVEKYCRNCVGLLGSGIRIYGDASNIRMQNNKFIQLMRVEFEIGKEGPAW